MVNPHNHNFISQLVKIVTGDVPTSSERYDSLEKASPNRSSDTWHVGENRETREYFIESAVSDDDVHFLKKVIEALEVSIGLF
jgi:hypothetical protein